MFFFEERWRQYAGQLGLQQMSDYLKSKGYGHEWPMKVFGPEDGAVFHSGGGKYHPSSCPFYEGFWWAGGFGAVQCSAAGELLPGAVYETMCKKGERAERCPMRRYSEASEWQRSQDEEGAPSPTKIAGTATGNERCPFRERKNDGS